MRKRSTLLVENIPKELQLIVKILQGKYVDKQAFQSIDWKLFIELAIHHRIYPVLYRYIDEENIDIPKNVRDQLEQLYRENTFQMLLFSVVTEQVSTLFTDAKIPILFLKGPTLGKDLYGDISLRTSRDIDLLIPIEKLTEAEELLAKNGYKKQKYMKTVLGDWKWRHHHTVYVHPEVDVKLEVHWRLHPGPQKEPSFNELNLYKKRSKLSKTSLHTLRDEYLFLYLITHGARHGYSRVRWLLDIKKLMEKELDWKLIRHLVKKYDATHLAGQALTLASQFLDASINQRAMQRLICKRGKRLAKRTMFYVESMVHLHREPVREDVSRYHKRYLFSLMSQKQKWLFLLSFFYPYPEDAETLKLPKQLHFLYFPLRPFLWLWRKTRQLAFS